MRLCCCMVSFTLWSNGRHFPCCKVCAWWATCHFFHLISLCTLPRLSIRASHFIFPLVCCSVRPAMTEWYPNWAKNNWKGACGQPIKNLEDFKRLKELTTKVEIKWVSICVSSVLVYHSIHLTLNDIVKKALQRTICTITFCKLNNSQHQ